MSGPAVVLLAKAPLAGCSKTRLAGALGAAGAAAVAAACIADLAANLRSWSGARLLVCGEAEATHPLLARLIGQEGWGHLAHAPGPLGTLLGAAFAQTLGRGLEPVLAIGADLPDLTAEDLAQALAAMDGRDAVLGPSADGGYYLLGLRGWAPEAFADIPWSTEHTLAVTLERLRGAGRDVALLPQRRDLDTPDDLTAFLGDADRTRLCPRTLAAARALLEGA